MAKIFQPPKLPAEDPELKRLREDEQRRAEEDRVGAIQDQLKLEGRLRRRKGIFNLLGGGGGAIKSLLGAG